MHTTWLLLSLPFLALAQFEGADPYAPVNITCPKDLAVIDAKGLSDEEKKWREGRLEKVHDALGSYLENAQIPDFDIKDFTSKLDKKDAPVVGLAISGGGTQSGVGGLSLWQAFDARYPPAVAAGTGGLTQLLSYLTGLSGGGFLTVGALSGNNFSSTAELTRAVNFSIDYSVGPTGNQTEYFYKIFENAGAKAEEGFPVTIADIFGQFFASFLTEEKKFSNFSDVALEGTAFSRHEAPMPLVSLVEVVEGMSPNIGGILYPGNNATNGFNLTSYEVSPLYFGSWAGGRVQAFFPTKYLGTNMSDGKPTSEECFVGFDKLSFVQGSTANAFNFYFIDGWYGIPLFAKRAISRIFGRQSSGGDIVIPPDQADGGDVQLVNQTASNFGSSFSDALWATYPNPFANYKDAPTMKDDDYLTMVDGSETGETIPLRPLMTPHRALDFIIAYDATSDGEYQWVNGTNLYNTHLSARESGGELLFPEIPDVRTLINSNATSKPTFFGCNATDEKTPLLLYLPNYPWSGYSNFTFRKTSFTDIQLNSTLENAFNVATYGNRSLPTTATPNGQNWPACLACAVIHKSLKRAKIDEPAACTECWAQYCWSGARDDAEPTSLGGAGPRLLLDEGLGFEEWNRTVWESEGSGDDGN